MFSPLRGVILFGLILSAACARHASRPFDAGSHRAAWTARAADSPDLLGFASKLSASQPHSVPFDPSDGISLDEAEVIGLFFNGGLRAARARLAVTGAGAAYAGLWPDPTINLGLQRLLDVSASPWVVAADAALSIPLWGIPGLERRVAESTHRAHVWRVVDEERGFIRDLRRDWIDWSALEMKASVSRDHLNELERVLAIAQALADAHEIPRTEARLFAIERASIDLEVHHLSHEAEERAIGLRNRLGFTPDAGVVFRPSILSSDESTTASQSAVITDHPRILALQADLEAAEYALNRELRTALPSLEAGPAYERDEGRNKVGAGAGVTLPLWNRNRRAIAEARAAVEAARVSLESEIERITGGLAVARHSLEASIADARILREEVAPLAEEQLREARALAELGEIQGLLLLDALKSVHATKLRMIDAQADIARAGAEIQASLPDATIPTLAKELFDHAQ